MSNKKSLLTESEIRRFMTLANIPALGQDKKANLTEMYGSGRPEEQEGEGLHREEDTMQEMAPAMEEEDEMPKDAMETGDEEMDVSGLGDGAAGAMSADELAEKIVDVLVSAGLVEKDGGGVEAGGEGMPELPDEEEAPEEEEEETGEEEEEEEEEEGEQQELQESKLVDTVLSRVTARLIAEAAKKKKEAGKKKKMTAAEKMKAMKAAKDKKKKLEEANAPAPKSTMSNASKAGVAKGAGKADKGAWGVSSKVQDMEWKEGKSGKGGHEMSAESASTDHIVSHGKKNLATQGGNKKK